MFDLTEDELTLIGTGEPIRAIKLLRERTGLGLREACDVINAVGLKAGLFLDEPPSGVLRRLRLEGKETPKVIPESPDTPETLYLMPWVNYYALTKAGVPCIMPSGIDPIKAVEALKKIKDIINNNSFKDKVVRVRHALNDFWRAFI